MRKVSAVISKAGGDAGRVYLVVGYDDRGYALCVDGVRHKLARPKSKNVRHIRSTRARTMSQSSSSLSMNK